MRLKNRIDLLEQKTIRRNREKVFFVNDFDRTEHPARYACKMHEIEAYRKTGQKMKVVHLTRAVPHEFA